VAQRAHRLVIAEQHRDAAAARPRFPLQTQQQLQRLRRASSPVEDIPDLHELGTPADPLELPIDELRALQDLHERIVRCVQVPDRDEARAVLDHPHSIARRFARLGNQPPHQDQHWSWGGRN